MILLPHRGRTPDVHPDAYVAPGAVLTGDVTVAAGASIWFGCVLRGDVVPIRVGAHTNIQDGTIVHGSTGGAAVTIGAGCTVGHGAILHGCMLEEGCFVGMRATVLDRAVVRAGAMLAAGALLTPGKAVPPGELWGGSPARLLRAMTDAEIANIARSAASYARLAVEYR